MFSKSICEGFQKQYMNVFKTIHANIISSMNMYFQLLPLQHHGTHSLHGLRTIINYKRGWRKLLPLVQAGTANLEF